MYECENKDGDLRARNTNLSTSKGAVTYQIQFIDTCKFRLPVEVGKIPRNHIELTGLRTSDRTDNKSI